YFVALGRRPRRTDKYACGRLPSRALYLQPSHRASLRSGCNIRVNGAWDWRLSRMINYSVREAWEDGARILILRDTAKDVEVQVAPQFGNIATAMTAHGKAVLWTPFRGAGEWSRHPAMGGVPFLWPWANRIDGLSYWVNGRKYTLNPDLGNISPGPRATPIHGLLLYAKQWRMVRAAATEQGAELEWSFEFWREPEMMAQFPFANTVTMIHRLRDGALEVETRIENLCSEPLPVSLGFHPYFRVNDALRDEWKVRLPAREKFVLNERLIPTGEKREPVRQSAAAEGNCAGRRVGRAGAGRGRMGALSAGGREGKRHGGVRRGLPGGRGVCAAQAGLRLFRTDERPDQCLQRGPRRLVQGAAGGAAGRRVEGLVPRGAGR